MHATVFAQIHLKSVFKQHPQNHLFIIVQQGNTQLCCRVRGIQQLGFSNPIQSLSSCSSFPAKRILAPENRRMNYEYSCYTISINFAVITQGSQMTQLPAALQIPWSNGVYPTQ